jgi:hypothetical protein
LRTKLSMAQHKVDIEKYCLQMEEVKSRIAFLESVLEGLISLGRNDFDAELLAVHIRKILELIAFSSMIANKDQYSLLHQNFAKHWNAKDLLDRLESINPDFYPLPVKIESVNSEGVKNLQPIEKKYLTKNQFISLYDRCSSLLHTKNPYSDKTVAPFDKADAKKWIFHIQKLLAFHRARMFGNTEGWLIVMQHESDGRVHGFPFLAVRRNPIAPYGKQP